MTSLCFVDNTGELYDIMDVVHNLNEIFDTRETSIEGNTNPKQREDISDAKLTSVTDSLKNEVEKERFEEKEI